MVCVKFVSNKILTFNITNLMAKKTKITAWAKLMAIAVFSFAVIGCDEMERTTFLGLESEVKTKAQTGYDNISLVARFDTTANKLFTIEQNVRGEIVSKEGSEESRQRFDQDLDLNVIFSSKPAKVYVAEKELLSEVGQVSLNKGNVTSSEVAKNPFKLATFKQRYDFTFNANEVVTADASWQVLKVAAKDSALAAATVHTVSYNKFTAVQNNVFSNTDSTVFDVNLFFVVELNVDGSRRDMLVRVPIQRIYKNGKLPDNFFKRIEDLSYNYQFDTTVCRLFTVKQEVAGKVVSYNNATVLDKKSFSESLDLVADAAVLPKKVYVASESALTQVAMTSQSKDNLSETKAVNGRFVKSSFEQNYQFNFNEGERVYINAAYEALAYGDTTLQHAVISNIIFSNGKSVKNTVLSNADSTVYNVNLFFVATVERENGAKIADYTIRVPYVRIFKHEKHDDEYEVKLEDTDYVAEFKAVPAAVETVKQNVSGYEVTYKNGVDLVDKKHFEEPLDLKALFSVPERVMVETEDALQNVKLANSSHDGDKVNVQTNGRFAKTTRSLNYNYRFNENERVSAATQYELLAYGDTVFVYSSIRNITFAKAEVAQNESESSKTLKVADVVLYFDVEIAKNDPDAPKTKANNDNVSTYRVAVPYQRALAIEPEEDKLIGKRAENISREIIDANTERLSFTEVETWSVSGEKSRTITRNLSRHLSEPALQWVYTANNSYTTKSNGSSQLSESPSKDGNWTITTRYMQYSSTATNGVNPFKNVYSYDFQKAIYVDADGYYTVTFDFANWNISEVASNVSQQASETTQNGVTYLVYNYQNKINTNYVITGDNYQASASAAAKIAIEKPIEPFIPEEWGKIIGMGVSAVPADQVGGHYAQLCFTLRTEKGAVAVITPMSQNVPTKEQILSGYFVKGSFGSEYNSGYYTTSANRGSYAIGKWAPAIAKDLSDRIAYYKDNTCVRNVRNTSLTIWNWRNGNLSTVVEGYNFSVSNGTLTISHNGKVVMRLR